MKLPLISTLVVSLLSLTASTAQSPEEIVIGTKHSITSEILSEERAYWISLPNSYNNDELSDKKYPIVIVLDGNVHFHSLAAMVNARSTGNSDKREMPEMIVVALLNVNRERDFTPDKIITKRENQTGGGDQFLAFIEQELIPSIERDYRTAPYRLLIGHSLAGLFTTHAYLKANSPFHAFVAIDPSFGTWEEEVIDAKTNGLAASVFNRPFYLATANWGEERNAKNRNRHRQFMEALHAKSKSTCNATQQYYPDKNHSTVPIPAIYDGLSFIFEGYHQSYRELSDVDELLQAYEALSLRNSFDFFPPEEVVNRIGFRFLRNNEIAEKKKALSFFQLNAENYPTSYRVFDSLGEAYYQMGKKKEALESFGKSLALNPGNDNAREMIERMKSRAGEKR